MTPGQNGKNLACVGIRYWRLSDFQVRAVRQQVVQLRARHGEIAEVHEWCGLRLCEAAVTFALPPRSIIPEPPSRYRPCCEMTRFLDSALRNRVARVSKRPAR